MAQGLNQNKAGIDAIKSDGTVTKMAYGQ
jgi:hypothetical protein